MLAKERMRRVERVVEAGETTERTRPLGLVYPKGVFSLSHVALPFPLTDSLYGLTPDLSENFGVNLGALAPRGERGTLIVSLDALLRMSSNPFFSYMAERIEERLPPLPTEKRAGVVYRRTPLVADATSSARRRSACCATAAFASLTGRRRPIQASLALGKSLTPDVRAPEVDAFTSRSPPQPYCRRRA